YEVKLKPEGTTPGDSPGAKTADAPVTAAPAATACLPSSATAAVPPETVAPAASGPKTDVFIEMTMTSPACPAGPQLIGGAKREVATLDGVGQVEVKIVLDPPWTPDRMTEEAKDQLGIF